MPNRSVLINTAAYDVILVNVVLPELARSLCKKRLILSLLYYKQSFINGIFFKKWLYLRFIYTQNIYLNRVFIYLQTFCATSFQEVNVTLGTWTWTWILDVQGTENLILHAGCLDTTNNRQCNISILRYVS